MKRPQQRTKRKSKAALLPPEQWSRKDGDALADRVRYVGSPYHKRSPGDYGMAAPPRPREDKTQCDGWPVHTQNQALELLKAALSSGMVSN
ncbi:hypothetical protein HH1059_04060 [Halorhodospira halochloris]|uniref:Uncharacterized protein n=1 Tax=Halorhodospira halochloris TaxID=1052 RepID=A0A2Z6EZB5_HALHR|nr:hypothetical protein [Halorhodospira halochloris]BBE10985.1 hypothetical protein HH1059_04060 [Halorhodospira halochloris]